MTTSDTTQTAQGGRLSQPRWSWHYAAVFALAVAVGILFIQEPGFGDELTYWGLAFDLHERGGSAWSVASFHALRWPVWGLIWLWQAAFGPGLSSYYFVPVLFLALAAVLVFTFGRFVMRSVTGAWVCVLAVLFSPVLDQVINRPMPDLPESVYGGSALLAWWAMMSAASKRRALVFGALSGLCLGLAFSNRVSGIFIAPVLAVATAIFYRPRWKWLAVPAVVSALFVVTEGAVYYGVCHDFLHSVHANLGGTGAKDVEVMSAWQLPVRYLSGFIHGNRFDLIYSLVAVFGLSAGWRRWGQAGKLMVVWFGLMYLEYSCAVQSTHPVRPLMGSTLRYLGVFAVPMALLTAFGVVEIGRLLSLVKWPYLRNLQPALARWPALTGVLAFAGMLAACDRPFFNRGFLMELRQRMAVLPAGTKIFSHHAMYQLACLADAGAAHRLSWVAPSAIINRTEDLERAAAGAEEFWYLRKLLWLNERKKAERNTSDPAPELGSYLESPQAGWILTEVLDGKDGTDIVLYRRRPSGTPAAHLMAGGGVGDFSFLPELPAVWTRESGKQTKHVSWKVPEQLRGKLLSIGIAGSSDAAEPVGVAIHFLAGKEERTDYLLRPVFHKGGGKDFFAISVPPDADHCEVDMKFKPGLQRLELTAFNIIYDDVR